MHELGVVLEVVESVEAFAKENKLEVIEKLVLQIGELSSMIPRYVEESYPCAVEGTLLENTELEVEIIPGSGLCEGCGRVYHLISNKNTCPFCGEGKFQVISGLEFMIKEVVAY